ncbi:MAG: hypothetical protein IJT90_03190 [Bacteroidaceae bacterium]|nr:hypothetical protein [Bacteroidaceae bacterium]
MKLSIFNYTSSIVLALVLLASCSSDDFISDLQQQQSNEPNIVSATMTVDDFEGDAQTPNLKTNITAEGKFLWARGDQVGVWPTLEDDEEPTSSQVLFTVTEGAGTASATFTGSGWGLLHNRTYYAYFPYNAQALSNKVTNNYQSGLNQMFNNMSLHIGVNDFMYASATTPDEGNEAHFQFHHMGSIMRIVIKLPAKAASTVFKVLTLKTADGKKVFPLQVTFNPVDPEPVETPVTSTSTLTLNLGMSGNGFKPTSNTITAWFLTGATDLTGTDIHVSLSNATDTYSGTFTGKLQQAGHARTYTVTAEEGEIAADYVDMGTDVMWARCNLGAESLENFGNFYAWGETTPYYTSLDITETGSSAVFNSVKWAEGRTAGYAWSNYFDATSSSGSSFKTYTKANQVLALKDDAANVALGGKWRMPTTEEVVELYNVCTLQNATVKGVRGVLFTSTITGNTLFIPGNGHFSGTTYNSTNSYRLWSSTLCSGNQAYGWYNTYSSPDNENMQYKGERNRGWGIRPVFDPKM